MVKGGGHIVQLFGNMSPGWVCTFTNNRIRNMFDLRESRKKRKIFRKPHPYSASLVLYVFLGTFEESRLSRFRKKNASLI